MLKYKIPQIVTLTPNNFFIALSYMILSIQFTILIHKSYARNKILVASIR